ncbi:hypothetical protein A3C87_02335 [Candidatus Kaiserbacteria bacterium RIFCSPHIGHO2_02_FULL_49_34]|uniref:ParB-like N-terminal domain-containing protein n=1 Tax=Candidatus Kaiserbacteria bacterium RIFCSPHIGHO2_02_FULL_49_34 TaxID=1798491 RepID=A0A1F6DM01_9BACT|nr:MAG: hypothetical protein A3C87_02335 [Candidatus Kaiserbacteria bacterium RIFCSPHIGHO2_02_FULL_49_34]
MKGEIHDVIDTKEAESAYESNSIFWVEVEKIVPNPYQPRKEFNEQKLQELAESIRMYGVMQPLVVTRNEVTLDNGAFRTEYELIAGERRLRASKLAGISQVPVIIRSGKETELMKLELAIIENLQREDLNPVDRALAFNQLAAQFGLNHTEIGKRMGRSRAFVANSIRLLGLPEHILDALRRNELSDGHARSLLMLKDRPEEQEVVFRETVLKKLSVREVEHLCRQIAEDKVRKKSWKDLEPELKEMERTFSDTLGTKVQIAKTDYGGRLVIDYFSNDDLSQLLRIVRGEATSGQVKGEEAARAEEVLKTLAASTGVEVAEVAKEFAQNPELSDGPAVSAQAMEEEVVEPAPIASPVPPFMSDTGEAHRLTPDTEVIPPSQALEVDDPNDHTFAEPLEQHLTEPLSQEITEPAMQDVNEPVAQPVVVAQATDVPISEPEKKEEPKNKGYTDDDLYSLTSFSL